MTAMRRHQHHVKWLLRRRLILGPICLSLPDSPAGPAGLGPGSHQMVSQISPVVAGMSGQLTLQKVRISPARQFHRPPRLVNFVYRSTQGTGANLRIDVCELARFGSWQKESRQASAQSTCCPSHQSSKPSQGEPNSDRCNGQAP